MELYALQKHYDEFQSLGAEVVAISPQTIDKNAEIRDKQKLTFPVLSDAGNGYANQWSIGFEVQDYLKTVYQQFGIELADFNGDDSWRLPMPARIIVDGSGIVRSFEADPDYTKRPEPEQTLAELRAALK